MLYFSYMEPFLIVSFSCEYKDRWKDTLRRKLSSLLWGLLASFVLIGLGIYFLAFQKDPNFSNMASLFVIVGVIGIILSPIIALFKRSGNKGFTGNITIHFYKNGNSKIYDYHLTGTKKGEPFESKEQVFSVDMKKYVAILVSPQGKRYYIPLRQLDENQIAKLKQIGKETNEKRTQYARTTAIIEKEEEKAKENDED